MRPYALAALALPLLAAGGFLAQQSDALRATPRPPAGAASLLGGLSAVAVQVLWIRADQALLEHREEDAVLYLTAITELEPHLPAASEHVARVLGYSLAEGHEEPRVRWGLARQGWSVLSRTVAHAPDDPEALLARAAFALVRISRDPAMHDGFLRDIDPHGPVEAARRDYVAVLRLDPASLEAIDGLGVASLHRGIQLLLGGSPVDAAAALGESVTRTDAAIERYRAGGMTPEELDSRVARRQLAAELAAVARAPTEPDADALYDSVRRRFPQADLPPLR